jgi:DNA-binding protein H-NS
LHFANEKSQLVAEWSEKYEKLEGEKQAQSKSYSASISEFQKNIGSIQAALETAEFSTLGSSLGKLLEIANESKNDLVAENKRLQVSAEMQKQVSLL